MNQAPNVSDKYYGILNTLSGKSQEKFKEFFEFIFKNKELSAIYELLLVCDDPNPIIEELWFYFITGMDPRESPTFNEYAVKYITSSVIKNFQRKDNDLSTKAFLVGNVPEQDIDFTDLLK